MDAHVPDSKQPPRESILKLVLLYPGLVIAAIGAVPQYIQVFKAAKWDVPVNAVNAAEREHGLWVKNVECTGGEDSLETSLADNTRVAARVCPSGDVLVKVKRVTGEQSYFWVPLEEARSGDNRLAALIGISTAVAQEVPSSRVRLAQACQHWQDQARGILVRRIRDGGQCYDETVNTFTGQVIDRKPVQCDARC
jgi:hypothetical protein